MESTTQSTLDIRVTGYGHPDAQHLSAEVQQEYVRRYGEGDETVMHPDDFEPPAGLFLIAYLDGVPVASGGWRAKKAGPHGVRDGDAELKRMFVVSAARGRGLARALLRRLEETGTEQPEAISLYTSEGYADVEKFGLYRESPLSVCMGKPLPAGPPQS
jgi:GNAT superfamily N-acetyltransferase